MSHPLDPMRLFARKQAELPDAALAKAFAHVIFKEYHLDTPSGYFRDYVKRYTSLPLLVLLEAHSEGYRAERYLRASDLACSAEWKTIAIDDISGDLVVLQSSVAYRWCQQGTWSIEARAGRYTNLRLSLLGGGEVVKVGFAYTDGNCQPCFSRGEVHVRCLPARSLTLADGRQVKVATVFDLMAGKLGIDRGLGGGNVASSYDDASVPGTPAWQEPLTGVSRERLIRAARAFADNADTTTGGDLSVLGTAMQRGFHMGLKYRGMRNLMLLCGGAGHAEPFGLHGTTPGHQTRAPRWVAEPTTLGVMNMHILKVIALLLDNPATALSQGHEALASAIDMTLDVSATQRAALLALLEELIGGDAVDVQARYQSLFEHGDALSLHLFEQVHGVSHNHDRAMLELLAHYQAAGFAIGAHERPDFLPLYLEHLAGHDDLTARNRLAEVAHLLALLAARLEERNSRYAACLRALLQIAGVDAQEVMEVAREQVMAEVRVETRLGVE